MRYSLLASAGLIAVAAAFTIFNAADAADCGCRDAVRAALAKETVVPHRQAPRRAARTQAFYDYRAARPVGGSPYGHHWQAAPQGPVDMAASPYGEQAAPYAPAAYAEGYGDDQPGITVDQGGWIGGVGYGREGGGGCCGGGGGVLTLAQPDSLNGPNYNDFNQSYGGNYQAANQVGAWRTQAFTPPASSSGSGSGSGSGSK